MKVNNVSVNMDYLLKTDKATWSKEHAHNFGDSETKAGEAYDSVKKQHSQDQADEAKVIADKANAGKAQADAEKKLADRDKPKAAANDAKGSI